MDAKGAIYLTTKNGTFPITLTSFKSHESSGRDTPKILSSTAKNLSRDDDAYWDERSDTLLSSFVNDTYEDSESSGWKTNQKRSINDAVSKNITLVLENLLKNYENSQLPTHGKGSLT